jgi:3-oxoacyl-[acyl-carrier-protein] synthase-3
MNPPTEETVKSGLHYLRMAGPELFKIAVKTMEQAVRNVLKHGNLEVKDIACLIPHQANNRILQAVSERLEIDPARVFINVDRYGNMSSASTAVALYEAVKTGAIKRGDYVVLVAFGGGLTWAANLIKW